MHQVAAPRIGDLADLGGVSADMLRATFDHWRIFEQDGRWRGIRPGMATTEGPHSLIHPVVCAPSLAGLADQLSMQEWFRRMSAAELALVWREGFTAVTL